MLALMLSALVAQGSQSPAVTVPIGAPVDEPSSRWSIHYRPAIAARVNPLGLFLSGNLSFRYRLYDHESIALKDNYVGIGPIAFLSPAFGRIGVAAEVQPLSILNLSASYEFIGFFRAFNFMQSYPSATAETSDRELSDLKSTSYSTYGGMLTLAAMLQGKVGPIALRSQFRAFLYNMKLRAGDRVFYDSVLDIMSPGNGWTITDDTDLLYVTTFGLAAGARYTFTHSFFGANDFAPGESQVDPNGPTHRVGPFFAYTFFDRPDAKHFNTPTLVLLAQWFIQHRYRAGQEVSRGFPWIAVAFQFKGVL